MSAEQDEPIRVRGARVHNLKGLHCELPRNRLVVITGPSGSGKSSLAFDTLFAEGQRRYVETLSAYARQFLGQVDRPEVEEITGLCPAIAIDQRGSMSHPRSTVGTATEIHDHLRVWFAALGRPHCPRCGDEVVPQDADTLADQLLRHPEGTIAAVLAPVVRGRKGAFRALLAELLAKGHRKARIDGRVVDLRDAGPLDPRRPHRIEVPIDRLALRAEARPRLLAALERAMALAADTALVATAGGPERLFSRRRGCRRCELSVPPLEPRTFSFGSAYGACPECRGLGLRPAFDPARIVPDESKSVSQGAIAPWRRHGTRLVRAALEDVAARHGFSLDVPVRELPKAARAALLNGDGRGFPGILKELEGRLAGLLEATAGPREVAEGYEELRPYLRQEPCAACLGTRLRPESLAVRLGGQRVGDLLGMSLAQARTTFRDLPFPDRELPVAERMREEVLARLDMLHALGLGYLTLDRATATLSGGEAQRIRLATQLAARMQGVLYVLDEPSIGLHPRDNDRLLGALRRVRDLGNTLVVVEHDLATIRAADWVLDLGEGAGQGGGRLMYQGPPASIDGSLTGRFLRGELSIPVPAARRGAKGSIRVVGARARNLKNIDVTFPLGNLIAVTGVSGSGKSSLVEDILYRALRERLNPGGPAPGPHRALLGVEDVDKVIAIDQSPIGRTPRSNPATYSGAFGHIREMFSLVPEARARGYRPGRFSFNVKGGRCEACEGDGERTIVMSLLPSAQVPCEACRGSRYNRETLGVLYRGRTIADVLDMTVQEARAHFRAHPALSRILETLEAVGLSYLRLGQSGRTLSGGEAQRLRLARELARRDTGRTVYLLDEPTTGLHPADVLQLLEVLGRLVEAGNTVVVVEHNLDVIKSADHVIDLGPEAGEAGGAIVAQGTPEALVRCASSHTGRYLAPLLPAPVT
jgi:excinuclease ABC subunit A